MGVAVWFFMKQFEFYRLIFVKKLGVLFAAIAFGIFVYVILNLLFNHEDLRGLKDIFSKEKILEE